MITTFETHKNTLSPSFASLGAEQIGSTWRCEGIDMMFSAMAARQLAAMKTGALEVALTVAVTAGGMKPSPKS